MTTKTPAAAAPEPSPKKQPAPRFKLGDRALTQAEYDAEFAKIQRASVTPPAPMAVPQD